jgi:hypothetical protein
MALADAARDMRMEIEELTADEDGWPGAGR